MPPREQQAASYSRPIQMPEQPMPTPAPQLPSWTRGSAARAGRTVTPSGGSVVSSQGSRSPRGSPPRRAVHAGTGISPRGVSPRATPRASTPSQPPSRSSSSRGALRSESPGLRSAERLYHVGTISSTISRSQRLETSSLMDGSVKLDGNASSRALNSFVFQLRKTSPAPGPAVPPSPASHTAAMTQPLYSVSHSPPTSSRQRHHTSPSSLATRKSPPRSHSPTQSPAAQVAFGSAREQRPIATTYASSNEGREMVGML